MVKWSKYITSCMEVLQQNSFVQLIYTNNKEKPYSSTFSFISPTWWFALYGLMSLGHKKAMSEDLPPWSCEKNVEDH
jgi:hypothetical protein